MVLRDFTLLYVEDDKNTQEAMKELLEEEVKVFYQASNGEEGLALFKEKSPNIILTDINMPKMSGLDMAEAMKQIDRTTPIVIISAFDDKSILLDAINMGIDSFVVKPIDIEKLIKKLEEIAQNISNRIASEKRREDVWKKKEQELYELAHYDTLTAIPNRFLFRQKFMATIKRSTQYQYNTALFFIDLDNFKSINDCYGHKAGDSVLIDFVSNVQKVIRKTDIFARIGGDEFALIIENFSTKKSLEKMAKKILEAVAIPTKFQENELQISCSIGISICIEGDGDIEELIHHADLAMYQAKAQGKSNIVFYG